MGSKIELRNESSYTENMMYDRHVITNQQGEMDLSTNNADVVNFPDGTTDDIKMKSYCTSKAPQAWSKN